jgi:EAL domain-containing protein (putative c-di-GMP-specific phosphodiesterase class I)
VVLEGIESESDAAWLKEIGCDFGQGFYFAGALSRQQVADFISSHRTTEAAPLAADQASGMSSVGGQA